MKKNAYRRVCSGRAWAVIGVALGMSANACGGDDSAGHVITGPAIPTNTTIVDDFERPVAGTEKCNKSNTGVCPGWYPFDDGSISVADGGVGTPEGLEVAELTALDGPMATFDPVKPSKTVMRVHGGPYSGTYGSGLSHQFVDKGIMSVEDYVGVVFWAKRARGSQGVMHVTVTTLDETAMMQLPTGATPICDDTAPEAKKLRCSDGFGKDIALHTQWLPYVIYFADLAQQGYGYKPPGGFDKKNATGINFGNKQGQPFDEYIDDIALFK